MWKSLDLVNRRVVIHKYSTNYHFASLFSAYKGHVETNLNNPVYVVLSLRKCELFWFIIFFCGGQKGSKLFHWSKLKIKHT